MTRPIEDDDPALAPWRAARTFSDLCALGARFVRGELRAFPGWGAPDLDEESDELLPHLEAAMAAGLLTVASQPGRPFQPGHDGRAWAQRAFVAGFAERALAAELVASLARAGLWCAVEEPGSTPPGEGSAVPVGLADGRAYLFAGHAARNEELGLFQDPLDPSAFEALAARPLVWCVDPVWGRRGALWRHLQPTLGAHRE